MEAKAQSVTVHGEPDGFEPAAFFKPEVLQGGYTRLTVSLPPDRLEAVHRALVAAMEHPYELLYQALTDRQSGIQLDKPLSLVAVEIPRDRLLNILQRYRGLCYHDGRHQLWVRGLMGEQVVLEEIGVIYAYPDDPSFRDALEALGVPEGEGPTLAERDYIKVSFNAAYDAEEEGIIQDLNLVPWAG